MSEVKYEIVVAGGGPAGVISKTIQNIWKELGSPADFHAIRHFSSLVFISQGKVLKVTEPTINHCPLAMKLYPGLRAARTPEMVRAELKKNIEAKIARFGFFTADRTVSSRKIAIPYGASEIMMKALQKKAIDAAVVVCEGAGTVMTVNPFVVQGIGARMNTVLFTSPVHGVMNKLDNEGGTIVSAKARIDQALGIELAARRGRRKIAVTLNSFSAADFALVRKMEKGLGIDLFVLAVCTTGIDDQRIAEVFKYSDLAWGCASGKMKGLAREKGIASTKTAVPIYVLTEKGATLLEAYGKS